MELNDKQLARLERRTRIPCHDHDGTGGGNENEMIVEGYATTFNQPYMLYDSRDYKIVEQIAPTAFDGCDMSRRDHAVQSRRHGSSPETKTAP